MPILQKKLPPNTRKTIFVVILVLLGILTLDSFTIDENTDSSETSGQETEDFEDKTHLVNSVIDGDTLIIENDIQIRLLDVDAPEQGECYYKEAREALANLVEGKDIFIKKDVEGKDSFGRLLRYVFLAEENPFLDNTFINKYLIENGYAGLMPASQNKEYRGILEYARNQARLNNVGLWSACEQTKEPDTDHPLEADDPPTDPNCLIKGNISKDGYGKTYFPPGCANYKRTKIDFSKGEAYFCTEEEAQAAGFTKAASCR
jgi:micrococcal nuclease